MDGTASGPHKERPPVSRSTEQRARRIPVFVIRTDRPGEIETLFEEGDWSEVRCAYQDLQHFNHLRPPRLAFNRELTRNEDELRASAAAVGERHRGPTAEARFH